MNSHHPPLTCWENLVGVLDQGCGVRLSRCLLCIFSSTSKTNPSCPLVRVMKKPLLHTAALQSLLSVNVWTIKWNKLKINYIYISKGDTLQFAGPPLSVMSNRGGDFDVKKAGGTPGKWRLSILYSRCFLFPHITTHVKYCIIKWSFHMLIISLACMRSGHSHQHYLCCIYSKCLGSSFQGLKYCYSL